MPWSTPGSTGIRLRYLLRYSGGVWSLAGVTVGEGTCVVMLSSVDICMWLFGAPGCWPASTPASWDLVRSGQQRSTRLGHSSWTRRRTSCWCRDTTDVLVVPCAFWHACWAFSSFSVVTLYFLTSKEHYYNSSVNEKSVDSSLSHTLGSCEGFEMSVLKSAEGYSIDFLWVKNCSGTSWISTCTELGFSSSVEPCFRFLDAVATWSPVFFPH